jgi:hypothetical protein
MGDRSRSIHPWRLWSITIELIAPNNLHPMLTPIDLGFARAHDQLS